MPKQLKTSEPNIVLFPQELYLENVKRNADGSLKSGWVINGEWHFEIEDGRDFWVAKRDVADKKFVTRWKMPETMQEIVVKRNGDYDDVIQRARDKLNAQATRDI